MAATLLTALSKSLRLGLVEAKELVGVGGIVLGFKLRRLMAAWSEVSKFSV